MNASAAHSDERPTADLTQVAQAALVPFQLGPSTISLVRLGENAVFRIDSPQGTYAMRIHRLHYRTTRQIESELAFMGHLADHGIDVPTPLLGHDGAAVQLIDAPREGPRRTVSVLSWVDGTQLDQAKEPDVALPRLGRALARLHNVADTFTPGPEFDRPAWDVEGIVGMNALLGDFRAVDLPDPVMRLFLDAADQVAATLTEDRGYRLIHGDLLENNALAVGERCVLIDLDDFGWGWYAFDIATMRYRGHHILEKADWTRLVLDGYRTQREFTAADEAILPTLWAARTLSLVGWLNGRGYDDLALAHRNRILHRAVAVCGALVHQLPYDEIVAGQHHNRIPALDAQPGAPRD